MVSEERRVPLQLPEDLLCVGIEKKLVRVEAVAGARIEWPVHTVAIELARPAVGQVPMPDFIREFRKLDAFELLTAALVEQTELDLGGVRREQREVHAEAVPRRAERERKPLAHT